jgi:Flp pilus assembly protein TadD
MNPEFASAPPSERETADSLYLVGLWLLQRQRYRDAAAVARALVRHAPYDERSWLILGACHEQSEQTELALEMYGVGRALAAPAPRCELARARLLRAHGMHGEASDAYSLAAGAAAQVADDDLAHLIECERRCGC